MEILTLIVVSVPSFLLGAYWFSKKEACCFSGYDGECRACQWCKTNHKYETVV